jgi:hypothetical protein
MLKVSERRGGGERGSEFTPCPPLWREEPGELSCVSLVAPTSGEENRGLRGLPDSWCVSPEQEGVSMEKHILLISLSLSDDRSSIENHTSLSAESVNDRVSMFIYVS